MQKINDYEFLSYLEDNNTKDFNLLIDDVLFVQKKEINLTNAAQSCLHCLDLTSLNDIDNDRSILNLINEVNTNDEDSVAGVCVYPNFINLLNDNLINNDVRKVCVAGAFPHGQSPLEVKLYEIKYAIDNGAQEVDIVMNRGEFYCGNFDVISREIEMAKNICGNLILKVILETGELRSYSDVFKASTIALNSGADFIKTSTGKIDKGADIYSFAIMLLAIRDYYLKTGTLKAIKASGGIATVQDALNYYCLFRYFISEESLNKSYFRIGGSRLKKSLIEFIQTK